MDFDPARYGAKVAQILALQDNGNRLMPLDWGERPLENGRSLLKTCTPSSLFPSCEDPREPMAGLWQYFDCFEEAHQLADACETPNGYYWHAIVHRREGDSGNATYWFRKTGIHPAYRRLADAAEEMANQLHGSNFRAGIWDPFAFVAFCEDARSKPGSEQERMAIEIQRAEWRILFDYCAGPEK